MLKGGSRITCLPCREDTIRGYSGTDLLLLDEAARVPDDVYRSVRTMLAASNGRMICLSTPYGKRGFFWDAWEHGGDDWLRIRVTADQIPRITAKFLEAERRALGESWYRQEYFCCFEALEGLVYPNFARCLVPTLPSPLRGRGAGGEGAPQATAPALPSPLRGRGAGGKGAEQAAISAAGEGRIRQVGGIDFGFRNPFAAVWGFLDADGILWITHEHYCRQRPLSYHAAHLPRDVTWYCDPAGASERSEMRLGGFTVREGRNKLRPGIGAVSARIESGRLFVVESACPNLIAEAGLYRYSDDPAERKAETPVDEHNHALAALRYLIASIDARHALPRADRPDAPKKPERPWLSVYNEFLWHRLD